MHGKRILFDTGNNAEIFAHNVKAKGIDLTTLDFAFVSHRHGDHTSGLNHLMTVNPNVKIYAPKENFGVFGAALPGPFYKRDESLPAEMRYFDEKPPETLRFGSTWPQGGFTWLAETIVEAAKAINDKPIHFVFGGTHFLPAKPDEINRIANSLRDNWKVAWIAPVHCTGEPAFALPKKHFGDRYLYAGLGTTLVLGPTVKTVAETGQPQMQAMDEQDLHGYRELLAQGHDSPDRLLAHSGHDAHRLTARAHE